MRSTRFLSQSEMTDYIRRVNTAALDRLPTLCHEILQGRKEGDQFVALNPTRSDKSLGSFKINLRTGVWRDFATDDGGSDPISLFAFIYGVRQLAAAKQLGQRLGVLT